jgi:polyisoprenoid-binding protein YceI
VAVFTRARSHWKGLLVAGVLLLVALAVGGPYLYIHVIEGNQPAALSLRDVPASAGPTAGSSDAPSTGSVNGTWTVSSGSQAGYRVNETLAGQSTTAVGRTSAVTGSLTIAHKAVTAASFTVQMGSVTSDRSQRDDQFRGRIMDTAQFPTGRFVLTAPIRLGSLPPVGKTVSVTATGNLTLHGTTRPVGFSMAAKRSASQIAVTGDIPISYGDYGIPNPSLGGFVSVGSSGTIEFLLVTTKH